MAFHELSFLFLFFPVAMVLYVLMPKAGRNALLVLLSLVFFAWGSPEYVLLLVLLILFNYFTGLQLDALKGQEKARKLVLWSAVAADLLLLGFFKYRGSFRRLSFGKQLWNFSYSKQGCRQFPSKRQSGLSHFVHCRGMLLRNG